MPEMFKRVFRYVARSAGMFLGLSVLICVGEPTAAQTRPAPVAPPTTFKNGQRVEVKVGDAWKAADIVNHRGEWYLVSYDGKLREWVEPWRVRKVGSTEDLLGFVAPNPPMRNGAGPPREKPGPAPVGGDPQRGQLWTTPPATQIRPFRDENRPKHPQLLGLPLLSSLSPDVAQPSSPCLAKPMLLHATDAGLPTSLLVSRPANIAAVLSLKERPSPLPPISTIERMDLAAGRSLNSVSIDIELEVLDLSPSGKLLLTRSSPGGAIQRGTQLDVWRIDGAQMVRVHSFRPFPNGGSDVKWSRFADETHLVLFGDDTLSGYTVGVAAPNWSWDTGRTGFSYGFSANRRYLAIAINTGIAILDVNTGKPLGRIDLTLSKDVAIAFKPDGSRLAVLSDGWLDFIDLSSASVSGEFSTIGSFGRALDWASEGYLLLDQTYLFSEAKKAVVWGYGGVTPDQHGSSGAMLNGYLYYASDRDYYNSDPAKRGQHVQSMIGCICIPDVEARDVMAAGGDVKMVLHPGMNVSLKLDIDGPTRQTALDVITEKLKANGFGVADNQAIKLVVEEFSVPSPGSNERRVIRSVSLFSGDTRIWGADGSDSATATNGEPVGHAAAEEIKNAADSADSFYRSIRFPKCIPKSIFGFGMTLLDARGTHPSKELSTTMK